MLTIGQLAKHTGLTPVAIRYYERCGLLPHLKRSNGGFRLYPESLISRFYFIQNAKSVGFSLHEIKTLIDLESHRSSSDEVKKHTKQKMRTIDEKIKTLTSMRDALSLWESACDGKVPIDECPILTNLYKNPTGIENDSE